MTVNAEEKKLTQWRMEAINVRDFDGHEIENQLNPKILVLRRQKYQPYFNDYSLTPVMFTIIL